MLQKYKYYLRLSIGSSWNYNVFFIIWSIGSGIAGIGW